MLCRPGPGASGRQAQAGASRAAVLSRDRPSPSLSHTHTHTHTEREREREHREHREHSDLRSVCSAPGRERNKALSSAPRSSALTACLPPPLALRATLCPSSRRPSPPSCSSAATSASRSSRSSARATRRWCRARWARSGRRRRTGARGRRSRPRTRRRKAPPPPCGTTVAEQPSTESDRTDDMVGPAQQGSHAHGRTAGLEGAPAGALQASLSSTTHDLLRFCAISRSTPTANAEVLCRWEGT